MRKIPTIFVRDWEGTIGPPGRLVLDEPHPDCGWVFAGEGVPTRKLDGTCCLVQDGALFKRHEVKVDKKTGQLREIPVGFDIVYEDVETGAVVGWLPVSDGPEDRWHRDAFAPGLPDGTYELIGPKVQGNPESVQAGHQLVPHSSLAFDDDVPTTFEGLRAWLPLHNIEGVVWHHPDGRMAKIKTKDFGLPRGSV